MFKSMRNIVMASLAAVALMGTAVVPSEAGFYRHFGGGGFGVHRGFVHPGFGGYHYGYRRPFFARPGVLFGLGALGAVGAYEYYNRPYVAPVVPQTCYDVNGYVVECDE